MNQIFDNDNYLNELIADINVNIADVRFEPKIISGKRHKFQELLTDSTPQVLDSDKGYVADHHPNFVTIELNRVYNVNSIHLRLWDLDLRDYYYKIEVSTDNTNWSLLVDRMSQPCRSWQYIEFRPTLMKFIRMSGYNIVDDCLHIIKFNAFSKYRKLQTTDL
jgi:hypothetical protein